MVPRAYFECEKYSRAFVVDELRYLRERSGEWGTLCRDASHSAFHIFSLVGSQKDGSGEGDVQLGFEIFRRRPEIMQSRNCGSRGRNYTAKQLEQRRAALKGNRCIDVCCVLSVDMRSRADSALMERRVIYMYWTRQCGRKCW